MPKTALKTFALSFSVSLFAIFAANGVYWHNRSSETSEIKIPSKNIALFLRGEPANPSNLSAPVKKIALNVLPEIVSAPPPAHNEPMTPEPEVILADNIDDFDVIDAPEIPLEIEPVTESETTQSAPVVQIAYADLAPAVELEPSVEAPPVNKTVAAEKIIIPPQTPPAADIHALIPPPLEAIAQSEPEPAPEPQPLLLAANDPDQPVPLVHSHDELAEARTKVTIGSTQDLNQVALADKAIPISSMEERKPASSDLPDAEVHTPAWKPMAQKAVPQSGSPWVTARAEGVLRNKKLADEAYYKKEKEDVKKALNPRAATATDGVKVAAETVNNLIIPIPEDILNDENLVPQLSFSPEDKPQEKNAPVKTAAKESPQNKIFDSLNALFSSKTKTEPKKQSDKNVGLFGTLKKKLTKKETVIGKIMPTEMRLSFQPNRAEISGQTLRWIQAFATKVAEDRQLALEIRIDGTSAIDLQQKRLNLLNNILMSKGVGYGKVNTVFTQREPNSFIIRTVTVATPDQKGTNVSSPPGNYYQQW